MVKLFAGTAAPQGWMLCDGRVLPAHEHPALCTMLGSIYGGDGRTTFALPDLRPTAQLLTGEGTTEPLAQVCAIKVANAPATATALAELRLMHQGRRKAWLTA
jgi:microcystin-dependent protein